MWWWWLVGCAQYGGFSDTDSDLAEVRTGQFGGRPFLRQVAARCDGLTDDFVFEARTTGWHESAVVDVWADPTDPTAPHASVVISTVPYGGISEGEWCDVMVGALPAQLGLTCGQLPELTLLFRVNFEEGCAGCEVSGSWDGVEGVDPGDLADLPGEECPTDRVSCGQLAQEPVEVLLNGQVTPCQEPLP